MKKSFDQWLQEVDDILERKLQLDHNEMADVNYKEWYENGVSPKTAATRAIKAQ